MVRSVHLTPRHKRFIEDVRACLYNLDIMSHRPFYEDIRFLFMSHGEHCGILSRAHREKTGPTLVSRASKYSMMVGVGFNMDAPNARSLWDAVFGNRVHFEAVYAGRQELSMGEVRALFDGMMNAQEATLREMYDGCWDQLRANEHLAIEDAFLEGGPCRVGAETGFYRHIRRYTTMGEPLYLNAALCTLLEDRKGKRHMRKRHLAETLLLEGIHGASTGEMSAYPL